jgi:hypothetical protein
VTSTEIRGGRSGTGAELEGLGMGDIWINEKRIIEMYGEK